MNQYLVEHVLEVTAPLSVRVTPEVQVTDSGRTAVFNCSVSGYPVTQASAACHVPRASVTPRVQVYWLHDGRVLAAAPRVSPGPGSLVVRGVGAGDRGQYQCVASNGEEESQAAASLVLGGE